MQLPGPSGPKASRTSPNFFRFQMSLTSLTSTSGTLNSVNVLEPSQKSVQLHASNHLKSLLDFRHPEAGELGRGKSSFPYPHPLLIFDRRPPPRYKLISLLSLKLPLKLKMTAIIFVMKLLSTRSPKLRLLYRLTHENC